MFGSSLPGADINRESKWFSSGSCEQSPVQQQLRGKHGWHDAKKSRPDGGWRELADTIKVLFRRPNSEPRTGPKPRHALLQPAANVLREHDFQTGASFILIGLNRAALFG